MINIISNSFIVGVQYFQVENGVKRKREVERAHSSFVPYKQVSGFFPSHLLPLHPHPGVRHWDPMQTSFQSGYRLPQWLRFVCLTLLRVGGGAEGREEEE